MLFLLSIVSWIAISVVHSASAPCQEVKTENWIGTLDVKVAKLRLRLEIKIDADGNCTGDMISLDQGSVRIAVDKLVRTDKKLEFEISKISASYTGTMNDDQTVVAGSFTQGAEYEMEFKRVADLKPEKHIQTWKGVLDAGGREFDFQFRVFEDGEGGMFAKLDSFSESVMGIPCEVAHEGDTVTVVIPSVRAKFVGTFSDDQRTIQGDWQQSGGEFPLELNMISLEETRSTELKRPQTPQPPFNYQVEEFLVNVHEIDSKYDAGVELAGTLTSPEGSGPYPTVILISGSGPQDRDETIFEHKPFLVIADHLTKQGFAVIRFDERGVGQSQGEFGKATSADFANDVEALYRWAKNSPRVDSSKIVLMGHSEGGLIAPMVASRQKEVAGVVMLAGPGVTGGRIILNQSRKIAGLAGLPENILDMQDKMLQIYLEALESGTNNDEIIGNLLQSAFDELSDDDLEKYGLKDIGEITVARLNSPWMSYFISYDPAEALSKTDCPILSVIGANDLQVDKELNFPAIEAAVKSGGNSDFVQKTMPRLNHLFQSSETGAPSDYVKIEQTIDPSLLDEITQWLKQRMMD